MALTKDEFEFETEIKVGLSLQCTFDTIMGRLKLGGGLERCNGNYKKGHCTFTKSPSNNTYLFLYRHSSLNGTFKELMSSKLWQIERVRI